MFRVCSVASFLSAAAAVSANAQISFEDNGFSGEINASGNTKSGNTQSTDLGLGGRLNYESVLWRHIASATYDFGRADGAETKNRLATDYEIDRLINHRLYTFGRGAYELDEFDGYEFRAVLGGGLGYDVLQGETRTWSVRGGPAYRIDEIEPVFDNMGALIAPAERQVSGALNLGSRFDAQLNDAVSFKNETDLISSADTTTVANTTALTAELMGSLGARFSFDVFHDTEPPLGAKATDTTTRAALVYTFGGE